MDAREEISRWLALLVQLSNEAESDQINADIKLLTGVTQQLSSELAKRNVNLAKQCRPNKPAIAQKALQKGPKKQTGKDSSRDAQGDDEGSQRRPEELSSIQQGIRQADPSLADQQRALRGYVYGAQNDDVALNKAAKAIVFVNRKLHDSLFDLYIAGGLELMTIGTRGLKRELIIDLETSALTPEMGEIIRYRAVNRFDPNDEFDEWARPSRPLSKEAEQILGVTNEALDRCRSSAAVMNDFELFLAASIAK